MIELLNGQLSTTIGTEGVSFNDQQKAGDMIIKTRIGCSNVNKKKQIRK